MDFNRLVAVHRHLRERHVSALTTASVRTTIAPMTDRVVGEAHIVLSDAELIQMVSDLGIEIKLEFDESEED